MLKEGVSEVVVSLERVDHLLAWKTVQSCEAEVVRRRGLRGPSLALMIANLGDGL